jgi:hypothetical protein
MSLDEYWNSLGVVHTEDCRVCEDVDRVVKHVRRSRSVKASIVVVFCILTLIMLYGASWWVLYHSNWVVK